ncbi:crossover junction endodeoxyribonuclease RuvC [Patescibacteria group bacterium]|nr:crossover junction endodeoxyribonuclease RuvC [Patescibacteria group bacterium]MBU4512389.1 crossover junction endodeoxyribonuclease RuvC [Patescibacteria group bacterium]MCG2692498.1 crossover junction endodeoxyribonuclease RuvC [Candidatus Parcubacteria bacterium]
MTKQNKKTIILGIDPGIATTGWGVIRTEKNDVKLVNYGCIITSSKTAFSERLNLIHKKLKQIIKKHKPTKAAVEELFFAKNVKTALKVGEARGVILLTAIQTNLMIEEFTPLQVKQALCAYGRAEKAQVQKMVKLRLNLKDIPKPDDAADALAVAICCAQTIPVSLRATVRCAKSE